MKLVKYYHYIRMHGQQNIKIYAIFMSINHSDKTSVSKFKHILLSPSYHALLSPLKSL